MKKTSSPKLTIYLMMLCLSYFMVSCGSDDDDEGPAEVAQEQQESDEGGYQAIFSPINVQYASKLKGKAIISIIGNNITAGVNVENTPQGTVHQQYVYFGTRCPDNSSDTNGDGIIDQLEAVAVSGEALVPLDNELIRQTAGLLFPRSNARGVYVYAAQAPFDQMMSDLRLPDINPEDGLTKIGPSDPLSLEGRVIIIHGVRSSQTLPSTVGTRPSTLPQATLPIACGVITRGINDDDEGQGGGTTTGGTTGEADPDVPFNDLFSTRLNPTLLIAGGKCVGTETINGNVCQQGQWIVTVDNVNTCSPEGACTEIGVLPFISNMHRANIITPTTIQFFTIKPVYNVSTEIRKILDNYWVRFDLNAEPTVLERP